MDKPKRPIEKSYSDVMNEWAEQRNLINADRSRLLHPAYDAHPAARLFGYLVRLLLLALVPAGIYLFLLVQHLDSEEFNTMISDGIVQTLGSEKGETRGAHWKFDGILSVNSLKASGGPGTFYEELEGRDIATRVAFPALFRKEWMLPRVSIGELSIALRSGGLGKVPLYQPEDDGVSLPSGGGAEAGTPKTGALPRPAPKLLRAGYGIGPDFKTMRINAVQMARLNTTWGSGPATSGALTGMQTDLTRTAGGWAISGNGGDFRQSWLDGMKLQKLSVQLGSDAAVINEAAFTRTSGGEGHFTGRMTLGELPEVEGVIQLAGVALQELVPTPAAALFSVEGKGTLKLSGSVNRSTGIRMEGDLEWESGRLAGVPVLKALHQLTGEDQFRLLTVRSGRVRFTSSGSEDHGGMVVEIKEFEADCGPLARLKGTVRHEHILEASRLDGKEAVDQLNVTGVVKLGLSSLVTAQLKPVVVDRFLKKDESGWAWLDIPVDQPLNSNFSKGLALEILRVSANAP